MAETLVDALLVVFPITLIVSVEVHNDPVEVEVRHIQEVSVDSLVVWLEEVRNDQIAEVAVLDSVAEIAVPLLCQKVRAHVHHEQSYQQFKHSSLGKKQYVLASITESAVAFL